MDNNEMKSYTITKEDVGILDSDITIKTKLTMSVVNKIVSVQARMKKDDAKTQEDLEISDYDMNYAMIQGYSILQNSFINDKPILTQEVKEGNCFKVIESGFYVLPKLDSDTNMANKESIGCYMLCIAFIMKLSETIQELDSSAKKNS